MFTITGFIPMTMQIFAPMLFLGRTFSPFTWLLLKLIVASIQVFPLWPILSFWPRFYLGTILDPNGRSLRDMVLDPGYNVGVNQLRPRVSRFTQRRFLARCRVRIQPMQPILVFFPFYTVHGAYAQLGEDTSDEVNNAVDSATKRRFFDDPLWISVPYCFLMKHVGKPPDNAFSSAIAFLGKGSTIDHSNEFVQSHF